MAAYYDEIEIEDMEFDKELKAYFYPCPCGDRFQISLEVCDKICLWCACVSPLYTRTFEMVKK